MTTLYEKSTYIHFYPLNPTNLTFGEEKDIIKGMIYYFYCNHIINQIYSKS